MVGVKGHAHDGRLKVIGNKFQCQQLTKLNFDDIIDSVKVKGQVHECVGHDIIHCWNCEVKG